MGRILVAGLTNIETTLRIDGFPLPYRPVSYPFHGIASTVSGVGYNVTKALATLGNEVEFLSLLGNDLAGAQVRAALAAIPVNDGGVLDFLPQSCQSVILYDGEGGRQIFTDLKDVQDRQYPLQNFLAALDRADGCALCNINFARPMLQPASAAGKLVATDVHAISDLDDDYNADYMAAAHVLFMSHERLPVAPEEWVRAVLGRYPAEIVVIGLGSEGALLAVRSDGFVGRFGARTVRPIVSTIGAGDALFSSFLDGYLRTKDPYRALHRAITFAGWKIGVASAAEGYLTAAELDAVSL